MTTARDPLVGRRAVYTRARSTWDEGKKAYIEVDRDTFKGTIVALVVTGSNNYPAVVMLYDDGSLRMHDIGDVTVEATGAEGPYR